MRTLLLTSCIAGTWETLDMPYVSSNPPNDSRSIMILIFTDEKLGFAMIAQLRIKGRSRGQSQAAPSHRLPHGSDPPGNPAPHFLMS